MAREADRAGQGLWRYACDACGAHMVVRGRPESCRVCGEPRRLSDLGPEPRPEPAPEPVERAVEHPLR